MKKLKRLIDTAMMSVALLLTVACTGNIPHETDTERLIGEALEAVGSHDLLTAEQQAVSATLHIVDPALADILSSVELTPKETFYCIMQYYGKTEQQKAQCFCCTEQALRSTKSRLGKKLDLGLLTSADKS